MVGWLVGWFDGGETCRCFLFSWHFIEGLRMWVRKTRLLVVCFFILTFFLGKVGLAGRVMIVGRLGWVFIHSMTGKGFFLFKVLYSEARFVYFILAHEVPFHIRLFSSSSSISVSNVHFTLVGARFNLLSAPPTTSRQYSLYFSFTPRESVQLFFFFFFFLIFLGVARVAPLL